MWPVYKTGEGVEPDLLAQFPLLEEALSALGITVWPMVEFGADDAARRVCLIGVFSHLVIAAPLAHDVAAVHGDRLAGNVARG